MTARKRKRTVRISGNDTATQAEQRSSPRVGTAIISGNTFFAKAVRYAEVDGLAIVEGDIVLGSVADIEKRTQDFRAAAVQGIAAGVGITGAQFRWPNCQIPFEIDANLPNQQRVTDAIAHWEANTNYRFIQRTAANQAQFPDFVRFVPGNGCSSMVGRRGGQQNVTLGAGCTTGSAIHEIGHVVGLWHEQSREDRDLFVTIQFQNITPGFEHNFDQHIVDGDDIGAYDYGSIMHYPRTAFSANGQDTIVPTDPTAQIGQRNGLSAGDIAAANSLCARQPTLKFRDDPAPTLKFRDDPLPTLKFHDDPLPTLKFRDDPTLKFADDPLPTLKFRDDPQPTLKFRDDPLPTLKFRDDPQPTLKFRDDPTPTLKFRDDPLPTIKFTDDPSPTIKFADDPQPTSKFRDDIGPLPPGPGPRPAPFVLSTPHHSMAWAQSFPDAYSATVAELEAELQQRYERLLEADDAYQRGALADQELPQLEAEYQDYAALLQEYDSLRQPGQ